MRNQDDLTGYRGQTIGPFISWNVSAMDFSPSPIHSSISSVAAEVSKGWHPVPSRTLMRLSASIKPRTCSVHDGSARQPERSENLIEDYLQACNSYQFTFLTLFRSSEGSCPTLQARHSEKWRVLRYPSSGPVSCPQRLPLPNSYSKNPS